MIQLIIGNKGSGKTKKLIDLVNTATETSKGNVVCVEKGDTLTYSITHKARLIDAESYGINGYGELYALLCGIQSANHDVTDIFVDATLLSLPSLLISPLCSTTWNTLFDGS